MSAIHFFRQSRALHVGGEPTPVFAPIAISKDAAQGSMVDRSSGAHRQAQPRSLSIEGLVARGFGAALLGLAAAASLTPARATDALQLGTAFSAAQSVARDAVPALTIDELRQGTASALRNAVALQSSPKRSDVKTLEKGLEALAKGAAQLAESDPTAVAVLNAALLEMAGMSYTTDIAKMETWTFQTPRQLALPNKATGEQKLAIVTAEVAALGRALGHLTAFRYLGKWESAPQLIVWYFNTVRAHLDDLRKTNGKDAAVATLASQFDEILARADDARLTRVYATGATGTFGIYGLPSPFTPRSRTAAATIDTVAIRAELASAVNQAKSIKSAKANVDRAFYPTLQRLQDMIRLSAKEDANVAASLIGDYNAAMISIRALTYELPHATFGTFYTPGRIALAQLPQNLWEAQLARELQALRGVLRPDLADYEAYDELFRGFRGLAEDLRTLRGSCKCTKLVADYNAVLWQAALAGGVRSRGLDDLVRGLPGNIR